MSSPKTKKPVKLSPTAKQLISIQKKLRLLASGLLYLALIASLSVLILTTLGYSYKGEITYPMMFLMALAAIVPGLTIQIAYTNPIPLFRLRWAQVYWALLAIGLFLYFIFEDNLVGLAGLPCAVISIYLYRLSKQLEALSTKPKRVKKKKRDPYGILDEND